MMFFGGCTAAVCIVMFVTSAVSDWICAVSCYELVYCLVLGGIFRFMGCVSDNWGVNCVPMARLFVLGIFVCGVFCCYVVCVVCVLSIWYVGCWVSYFSV